MTAQTKAERAVCDLAVKHETNPLNGEFTLCGDAFDADAIDGEVAPIFSKRGEHVTCEKCLIVIRYCKDLSLSAERAKGRRS